MNADQPAEGRSSPLTSGLVRTGMGQEVFTVGLNDEGVDRVLLAKCRANGALAPGNDPIRCFSNAHLPGLRFPDVSPALVFGDVNPARRDDDVATLGFQVDALGQHPGSGSGGHSAVDVPTTAARPGLRRFGELTVFSDQRPPNGIAAIPGIDVNHGSLGRSRTAPGTARMLSEPVLELLLVGGGVFE